MQDAHRAGFGATELRAGSGLQGRELASEGLDIALGRGRAAEVLAWAERWRATTLRMTPVTAPADPELTATLAELRTVSAVVDGIAGGRLATADRRRQHQLEQRVRELTRRIEGTRSLLRPPGVAALAAALGPAVLLELVAHRGTLRAVVVRDGRAHLRTLGPLDDVRSCSRQHRFALRRLITLHDAGRALETARDAAGRLDGLVLGPLRELIGARPLVIAPVGELHALAWAALPGCSGRAVTVVPSAASWLQAATRPRLRAASPTGRAETGPAGGGVVLVAGPRLPEGEREVAALAAARPGATVLRGEAAGAEAVTAALRGAGLAHIAAHGTFRADAPLLSAVELADGPLTAYEMERLSPAPEVVVLSACDSGVSAVQPGDELLGLGAVLLGAGTRTLVASVLPVPAGRTADLMIGLHTRLHAGTTPAAALAGAQHALSAEPDPLAFATAAAFRCIGAG